MDTRRHLRIVPSIAAVPSIEDGEGRTGPTVSDVTEVVRHAFTRRSSPLTVLDLLEPEVAVPHLRVV